MTTVFIGGSRRIGRLNDAIRARLYNIVERGLGVVIGDANGSDRAVQAFLAEKGHKNAVVYCMEDRCRNNVGDWPVRVVQGAGERGFDYYTLKDAEMARSADCGLMIWDGTSKGTLLNIMRLVESSKPVVVYFSPDREFKTIRTKAETNALLSRCSDKDRHRLSVLINDGSEQGTLFSLEEGGLANKRLQQTARMRRR